MIRVARVSTWLTFAAMALSPGAFAPAACDTLEETAEILSDGSYWLFRGLPPALALFGGHDEERIGRRMLDAGIAAALAAEGLKRVTRQPRPDDPSATDGFPSGHATAAWALAEAAGTENPDLRPYTYAFAAAVTWSRVELNRHTAWQALAGAALGYAVARGSASADRGLLGGLFVNSPAQPPPSLVPEASPTSLSVYRRPVLTLWEVQW